MRATCSPSREQSDDGNRPAIVGDHYSAMREMRLSRKNVN
jgi:hypothetical protein